MRLIGHVANESNARTFGNYLYTVGIENQVEFHKGDGWAVWVMEEDKLQRAEELLRAYLQNPAHAQYTTLAREAEGKRAQEDKAQEAYEKRVRTRRHLFRPLTAYGFGPVTFVLIAASVLVFFLSGFSEHPEQVSRLFISLFKKSENLPEVRSGQFWRLFTPMFIHFGVVHILFNMLWLRDLGSMIEARQNSLVFIALVLVIAALSNLAQYYANGPFFGGMSGVVYGLFGYVWIRGRLDPASGLFVNPTTVSMMLIWLVLCFMDIIPHVANYAHFAGLAVGAAWGYLSSLRA
jgi:GlpG protein